MSDAGLHPTFFREAMMVVRTYPIRVAGNSGWVYPDQTEITWEMLGVEPEKTTVTNKIRRVFTWSDLQFIDAVLANRPTSIFVNFMNYIPEEDWDDFLQKHVYENYLLAMGAPPKAIFIGTGPRVEDVMFWK